MGVWVVRNHTMPHHRGRRRGEKNVFPLPFLSRSFAFSAPVSFPLLCVFRSRFFPAPVSFPLSFLSLSFAFSRSRSCFARFKMAQFVWGKKRATHAVWVAGKLCMADVYEG